MKDDKKSSLSLRLAAGLAVGVITASLLVACGNNQSPAQFLESGKSRMQKQDYKAAIVEFKNALQRDGSFAEARFWLGKALLESGELSAAWVELNKAQEAGYKKDEVVPVLASVLILQGEVDKVISEYGDVKLSDPARQADLKAALATAYGSKGKYAEARKAADEALKANPDNIVAQLAVAHLLMLDGDKEGAAQQVERTLKAHPESPRPWITKAEILHASGADPAAAIAAYREALKRDKNNNAAHIGIIGLLLQQRDYDAVKKQLADLDSVRPGNLQVLYFNTLLAMERKDFKAAYEFSQQLLKAAPSNARFLQLAGSIEYERGAYLQAVAHLGKALANNPSNPVATRTLMARAQLRAGDPRKALSFVQPLLDSGGALPPDVYSVAGDAYLQTGNGDAAKKMYAKAVQGNPDDMRGRTALALAQFGEGRPEQAMTELKSIAASNDAGAEADTALVVSHIRHSQFDQAQQVLENIERKRPGTPVVPFFRAQIEQRLGHADKAREQFELAVTRQPSYLPAVAALASMDESKGQMDKAVARYEKLVAAAPQSVSALMGLVSIRARAGAPAEELKSRLEAAVQKFPESDVPRVALTTALLEQGQVKNALQVASDGVARFPASADLQEMVGVAELRAGNFNQAMQAFNKMAALQPGSAAPLVRLSEVALSQKDVPGAIAQLRKAVALKPDYVPAQANLITLLSRTGRMDEALAQAKRIQALLPGEPYGWTFEGDLQASKGNKPAAVAALRTSYAKRPAADTAMKLHRALVAANMGADADKLQAEWFSKQPEDPAFNFYLGDLAMGRQEFAKAEQQYRKVLSVQPKNPVALNNLAWLLHRAGKPGAQEMAEKALALAPNSTPLMDTTAEIEAGSGKLDRALTLQKRAVELDPDQPIYRLHLAQYLIKAGQKEPARVELQRLAQLGAAFGRQDEVQKLMSSL